MNAFENSKKMLDVVLSFRATDGSLRRSNSRAFVSDGEDYLLLMTASDNNGGIIKVMLRIVRAMSYFVVWEYNSSYEYKDFDSGWVMLADGHELTKFKINRGSVEEAEHLLMIALLSK